MATEFKIVTRREELAEFSIFERDGVQRFICDIPTMGRYTATTAAQLKWQQRGKEACLDRCADVLDGERDKAFQLNTFCHWPLAVLACMCAEWDGE